MGAPQSAGSRTKGGSTAVEAFRRVICNSQIHTETNRATQQVSHSFSAVTTPCNPDSTLSYWESGSSTVARMCGEPDQLPSSS